MDNQVSQFQFLSSYVHSTQLMKKWEKTCNRNFEKRIVKYDTLCKNRYRHSGITISFSNVSYSLDPTLFNSYFTHVTYLNRKCPPPCLFTSHSVSGQAGCKEMK